MRVTNLKIIGFRGFNHQANIPLDSNVVIVYGLNGAGKSSFTEALEWIFFDEISRRRLSRCLSEYQHEEYLRNLFYAGTENPCVEVSGTIKGKAVIIRKEITSDGNKYFVNNADAMNLNDLGLKLENYFRPMLAQTEIKALVDSEQKDRWEQLASILGQDDLTRLRERLIDLGSDKRKDEEYKKYEARLNSLISDISDSKAFSAFEQAVRDLDLNQIISKLKDELGGSSDVLQDFLELIKQKLKSLLNSELGKRVTEITFKTEQDFSTFTAEIIEYCKKLEENSERSTQGTIEPGCLEFLDFGAKNAKPPTCPFCLEKSLKEVRLQDIQKCIGENKKAQEARVSFKVVNDDMGKWLSSFSEKITLYLPSQKDICIISQKLIDINEKEIAAKVQAYEKEVSSFVTKIPLDLEKTVKNFLFYLESKYLHKNKYDEEAMSKLALMINGLAKERNELDSKWRDMSIEITEKFLYSGEINQDEIRKMIILEKIVSFFIGAGKFIKMKKLLKLIESIQSKLENYEKSEVTRLLSEHADEIRNYYKKLNPDDDIQFTGIEVSKTKKGETRRWAKLKAQAYGKDVNPVTLFSEAHTNSLALSIYFPQRVDRNSTWELAILDDPVQSMDANHSDALIDILADTAKNKQIIILTHSKEFYRKLCARFRHLTPKVFNFFYNDESGPTIKLEEGDTLSILKMVEEKIKSSDSRSLEDASHQLRKGIESVCIEFLLSKGIGFSKVKRLQ